MNKELLNKIALITGASSGIGEACAIECAAAGANVILVARRDDRLQRLAGRLQSEFQIKTHTLELDIRDKDAVDVALQNLPAPWSQIDILINNAGLALSKDKIQDALTSDLECMIDTNIKGLIYVTKNVLPTMLDRAQGHIVNIGSIAGHETYAGGVVYCATKFAVSAMSAGLKKDLNGTPIRVSLISPGMVKTELSVVRFKGDQQKADEVYSGMTPLSAYDIADSVMYCITRPAHVNISEIFMLPTDQASASMVHRNTA